MTSPSLPERVQALEDEVAGLESMIDSRTRTLWAEIEKLRGEVANLQRLQGNLETAQKRKAVKHE